MDTEIQRVLATWPVQLPGDPDAAGFDDYLRFNGSGVFWNKKAGNGGKKQK